MAQIPLRPAHLVAPRKKPLGSSRYGRIDDSVCSPDGPSPGVTKPVACRPRCSCLRCRTERAALVRLERETAQFRRAR